MHNKQKNKIIEFDGYAIMYIKNNKTTEELEVIIDNEDISKIQQHKWVLNQAKNNRYYFTAAIKGKTTRLHRYLLDYTGNKFIDHIDGNTLDNRKKNLRIVDSATNAQNNHATGIYKTKSGKYYGIICYFGKQYRSKTSEFLDVAIEERRIKKEQLEQQRDLLSNNYYNKKPERNIMPMGHKWEASYTENGKYIHLGLYDTKEEAIAARNRAEAEKLKRKACK